ncbi:VanZ family protein [Anaerobacillus alkalidiazotrophicus]|uniref:VanZ family protein n=1 Tax=Anaerobacillus alkalidiazotrophicus TaxID=472963 RepID=UPI000A04EBF8|nr:VanZ family protein [Anaerobacillus alkalidiazotrophicus]
MRTFKLVLFYWLPVLFMATIIFVASSQSYEQQDIKPYLGKVTDIEKVKVLVSELSIENAKRKLYEKGDGLGLITLVTEQWMLFIVLLSLGTLALVGWFVNYLWKIYKRKGLDYLYKVLFHGFLFLILAISFIMLAVFMAFRIESILLFLKRKIEVGTAIEFLKNIQFTYATAEISIARLGVESFLEFVIRKGAHFTFFFCLGFLFYRAMWASSFPKVLSFISSLCFVVIYAISDELHQAFTPNRTPLVQDVVLDSVGGLTGIVFALFIYFMIDHFRNQKQSVIKTSRY